MEGMFSDYFVFHYFFLFPLLFMMLAVKYICMEIYALYRTLCNNLRRENISGNNNI